MSKDEFEVEEGKEVVRRTIVGGRPLARRTRTIRVPIGIEKVLVRAAADASFRMRLFEDRVTALRPFAGDLSQTEADVLAGIPSEALREMVGRIDLKRHATGRFMKGVLAAALAASASTIMSCEVFEGHTKGAGPDQVDVVYDRSAPDAGVIPGADVEVEDLGIRAGQMVDPPDAQDAGRASDLSDVDEMSAPVGILQDAESAPDEIEVDSLPAPGGILPDAF